MNKAKDKDFDNILDDCLERVMTGGETVEQCLARYPDDAAELEPLLRTALAAREAADIRPSPEFRERARYQFQAAIREMETQKRPGIFGWQPRWATALVAVLVLLLASGGTVAAASGSMPDEPLYQVKLATEAVRLTLTPSALGKAELYVKYTDKRVVEIIEMADEGKYQQVESTALRLNDQLLAMATLDMGTWDTAAEAEMMTLQAEPAGEKAPLPAMAPEMAQAPTAAPAPAPVPAPPPATGAPPDGSTPRQVMNGQPEATEEDMTAVVEEAPMLAVPKAQMVPGEVGQGQDISAGDEDTGADKQADLRWFLATRAAENQAALRQVLERVPESVRPALEDAIKLAGAGYEEAISNLY
jgi:hypothetical protein